MQYIHTEETNLLRDVFATLKFIEWSSANHVHKVWPYMYEWEKCENSMPEGIRFIFYVVKSQQCYWRLNSCLSKAFLEVFSWNLIQNYIHV